jgi:hypothetical protein
MALISIKDVKQAINLMMKILEKLDAPLFARLAIPPAILPAARCSARLCIL